MTDTSHWVTTSKHFGPEGSDTGFTIWFTGLSGAGKSTIAELVAAELESRAVRWELLDGDVVRTNLSKGLGFSKEDRDTNILRIGWVAERLAYHGAAVLVSAISPYREIRDHVRKEIPRFCEVFVKVSVEEATRRDTKGLYEKALKGEIKGFTGVDDPYEAPENPELVIDTEQESPKESAAAVVSKLEELGYIRA
ncbi:MAG: adenylyl-sulfate kinase [Actinomycetota bacterium]